MYRHLLSPVDGSTLSEAAFRHSLEIASDIHAQLTVLRVVPEYHLLAYDMEMLTDTREEFTRDAHQHVTNYLRDISRQAEEAGVECDTAFVVSDHPFEEIIKAAQSRDVDLIVMGSHGRRGVKGLLIGSVTQKVLTHSTIPVLVYR